MAASAGQATNSGMRGCWILTPLFPPQAAMFRDFTFTMPCPPTPGGCNASGAVSLKDLTPWNQATWVTMRMSRPQFIDIDGKLQYALLGAPVDFFLSWDSSTLLDGVVSGSYNSTHVTRVFCPPREVQCSSLLLLSQPYIQARSYNIAATFRDPLAPWAALGVSNLIPAVTFTYRQGFIDAGYTSFMLGYRVVFIVLTCFIWLYYAIRLCSGPGNRDEAKGTMLRTSPQQVFVAMLGVFLIFFNDPLYLLYITYPSVAVAGAQAFFTSTFIATLLFFFLVSFDLARMQGENGLAWDPATADPSTRPGVCFWLPKVMLMTIFWCGSLAAYMFVRLQQQSDPAYSIIEASGPFWVWIQLFVTAFAGLYVLYTFILLVLGFRRFGTMSPSNKFLTAVTVTTLVLLLAGVFTSSFTGGRQGAALLLVVYGSANFYTWTLMFLMTPAPRPVAWTAVPDKEGPSLQGGAGRVEAEVEAEAVHVDVEGQGQEKHWDASTGGEASARGAAPTRAERVRRLSSKPREEEEEGEE
jgi:hypothetical protein